MKRHWRSLLVATLACLLPGCATSADDAKKDDKARAPQASSAAESAQKSDERPADAAPSANQDEHDDSTSDRSSEDETDTSGDSEETASSDDPTRKESGEDKRRKRMAKKVENKTIVESIGTGESGDATSVDAAFENTESDESPTSDANDTEGIGSLEADEASETKGGCARQKCGEENRVTLTISDIEVSGKGSVRKESIEAVAKRGHRDIQHCLQRALISDDDFPRQGTLVAEITIGREGRVVKSSVETDGVEGVSGCAERALKRWRFPRPKGGEATAEIDVPFQSNGQN